MAKKIPTIRVHSNPFCSELDHEGRAHGRLIVEGHQANQGIPPRYVGARLLASSLGYANSDPKAAMSFTNHHHDDMVIEYDPEPTTVPMTAYYLRAIREHGHHGAALFLADEESHKAVHGSTAGHRHPHARIAQLAQERCATPVFYGAPRKDGALPDHEADDVRLHFASVVADGVASDAESEAKRHAEGEKALAQANTPRIALQSESEAH